MLIPVARGSIRSWVFPRVMQPRRTLIVGSGDEALLVYRKIKAHPEYGLEIVGFLSAEGEQDEGLPEPVIGSASEVAGIVDSYEVDRILIASSVGSHEETLDLLRTVHRPDVHVSIVPRYFEIFTSYATLDDVEGMPVVTLPPIRLGRSARALKRTVDIVVSGDGAARPRAAPRRGRGGDQARQQGHGALPAGAPRPAQLDLPHLQVPDDVHVAPRRAGPRCCT